MKPPPRPAPPPGRLSMFVEPGSPPGRYLEIVGFYISFSQAAAERRLEEFVASGVVLEADGREVIDAVLRTAKGVHPLERSEARTRAIAAAVARIEARIGPLWARQCAEDYVRANRPAEEPPAREPGEDES